MLTYYCLFHLDEITYNPPPITCMLGVSYENSKDTKTKAS